jgi:class 3 adenylate cyclase/tetratricopeptide (TPR) repeat protein
MTCANCGTANESGRKFCIECGSALAAICPSCGTPNPPAAKFCGECATALGGARASTAVGADAAPARSGAEPGGGTAAPLAERRLVSVLFADLVGFTPFAETRDAEDVREALGRYFDLARDIVERYGGTVEKFIGDAVMAVWGAPTAREDDAERAVRAALELVDAVRVLGPEIAARAGVLTGEAAVTIGAQGQGLVAGDLVNTASRLQSVAPPGAVLVGEGTHRAASGAIAFERAGEQVLKGKAAPVAAWRALRVVANRGGQGRSDLPEPPFVGRHEELRVLKEHLAAQSRDPRVRIVSVTGPAGIGKSRLAWELEKYIDGLVEPVYWHRGRSPSYGEGITFWALGEMIRQRAGLAESDDEATTRARIADMVAEYVAATDDRRLVEPAMLALLGVEPAPAGGRDVMFAAWRIFFERIATRGTTVLVFEDIHWADSGLLDFIDHLAEWARGAPILIVTLARPELFERRPTWGAGRRTFTSIALEPLAPAGMRALLAGFVPGLPEHAVEVILARADGIPLYAVETVRSLVAEGRLQEQDGSYRPTGNLAALAIPETLQSLIASRLDALEAADRALIQDAAVLGQTFAPAALAAVHGTSEADLEPRLRALARRELLEVRVDPRSPERGQYGFVQSLIREVAYATLARRDRRTRHLAVARYFEGLGDQELAGALATHYLAAYRASAEGQEADAIAIQARLALRAAAARAASLGAHDQAVTFLQQAVEVTTDPVERADELGQAAASAAAAAAHALAIDLAERAVAELGESGSATARARAIGFLGRVNIEQGQIERALGFLETALALSDGSDGSDGDEAVRARILADLARVTFRRGDAANAIDYADQSLAIAERLDLEGVLADAFNNKAAGLSQLGRSREAAALMQTAVDVAVAGGYVEQELRARGNLASVMWDRNPARALEVEFEAHARAERMGNRNMADWSLGQLTAGLYEAARDWDFVLERTAEVLARGSGDTGEAQMWSIRGLILAARDQPDARTIPRLTELSGRLSDQSVQSCLAAASAWEAELRGDPRRTYDQLLLAAQHAPLAGVYIAFALHPGCRLPDPGPMRAALDRLDAEPDAGSPLSTAIRNAGRAVLAAKEGRREESLEGLRTALPRLTELGYDMEVARFTVDAILVLGEGEGELRRQAESARSTFARVGAQALIRQLDEALAAGTTDRERPPKAPEPAAIGVVGPG